VPGNFQLSVHRSRAGLGLFADEPIPKGACVIEYTGRHLTDAEYDMSRSRYLFDLGDGKVLDGSPRWNRARYINHSCVPNCEPELHKRRVFIFALRDIAPGDELAYNYGKEYFDEFIGDNCRCPKCMPDYPARPAPAFRQAAATAARAPQIADGRLRTKAAGRR
jgi:SET domain-containing protein